MFTWLQQLWHSLTGTSAQSQLQREAILRLAREQLEAETETETSVEHSVARFKADLARLKDKEMQLVQGRNEILFLVQVQEREDPTSNERLERSKHYAETVLAKDIEQIGSKIADLERHICTLEKRLIEMKVAREVTRHHAEQIEEIHANDNNVDQGASVDLEQGVPFLMVHRGVQPIDAPAVAVPIELGNITVQPSERQT